MARNVHTVPHGDGWANRRDDAQRVSNTAPTKDEAEKVGRGMAKRDRVEHLIHRRNGTIGERNSYGHDPYPPRG
jgi:hypothetical protein